MKNLNRIFYVAGLCLAGSLSLHGQAFKVPGGSTGADGALNITANTELHLPPNGVFNFTTVTVKSGATLKFKRNARNTPVYLLATGDVIIESGGKIDVSGASGNELVGGKGGPGGFDGGNPGAAGLSGGRGLGPGGGGPGIGGGTADSAGAGAYAHAPSSTGSSGNGVPYGGPLLIPLVGGSGGGGVNNGGGGPGGGGAILVCSDTLINLNGQILANAGDPSFGAGNLGSGGGIRLVARKIKGTGEASAVARGNYGSGGRIRVDTHDRTEMQIALNGGITTHGSFVVARLATEPTLDIVNVAGQAIPVGSNPVEVLLPTDAPMSQSIQVRAENFGTSIDVEVALKPVNGTTTFHPLTIDNAAANPAFGTLNVNIPGNTLLLVEVYKR